MMVLTLGLFATLYWKRPIRSDEALTPERLVTAINRYVEKGYFVDFSKKESGRMGFSFVPIDELERAYYSNCLRLLDRYGHAMEGIGVNEPVAEKRINLYFLDKDPEGEFTTFRNNCTYVGHHNVIIFDAGYLINELFKKDVFLSTPTPGSKPSESKPLGDTGFTEHDISKMMYDYIRTLVMWVVGHEIGHIAHSHQKRHYHFAAEPETIVIRYNVLGDEKEEREADEFAVEAIGSWQMGHYMWMGLSQLAANPKLYGVEKGPGDQLIVHKKSQTHPPLYVRFLDLSIKAIQSEMFIDSTGHFEKLRERIVIQKDK